LFKTLFRDYTPDICPTRCSPSFANSCTLINFSLTGINPSSTLHTSLQHHNGSSGTPDILTSLAQMGDSLVQSRSPSTTLPSRSQLNTPPNVTPLSSSNSSLAQQELNTNSSGGLRCASPVAGGEEVTPARGDNGCSLSLSPVGADCNSRRGVNRSEKWVDGTPAVLQCKTTDTLGCNATLEMVSTNLNGNDIPDVTLDVRTA